MTWVVSVIYLNGVRTVTAFPTQVQAMKHADSMTEFKGCRVFVGWEVVAQSHTITQEDSDGNG